MQRSLAATMDEEDDEEQSEQAKRKAEAAW
jgi:hypothetical protein